MINVRFIYLILLYFLMFASALPVYAQEEKESESESESAPENIPLETDWGNESDQEMNEPSFWDEVPVHFRGFARESVYGNVIGEDKKRVFSASESRLRGEAVYSSENIKAEVSGNLDYVIGNRMESPETRFFLRSKVRNRALSMETVNDHPDFIVKSDVHRLNASYRTESFQVSAGRQIISWGEGRFFNPMNLVSPVSIFLMDIEDIPGQDLVNIHYYVNLYDSVQFVAVPYTRNDSRHLSKLSSLDTNALLRYKGTFGNADVVLVGGQHFHSAVWGFESTVTMWDAAFRIAYLGRQEDLDKVSDSISRKVSHQGILGVSYAFFKGKVSTAAEIFFNSAYHSGDEDIQNERQTESMVAAGFQEPIENDEAFFRTSGRIFTRNPYLVQFSVGGGITEILNLSVFSIADPVGKSIIYGPSISYSFSDEGIFTAGARLYGLGRDSENAEFKGGNPMIFGLVRVYI